MRRLIVVSLVTVVAFFWVPLVAYSQKTASLAGTVLDAANGKPMPFANVYVNGSTQGAVTDDNGAYNLTGIPLGTVEVVASFVGYQAEKFTLRFDNTSPQKANFRLKPSVEMLEAVVVKGNQKRSEKHLRQFKKQLFGEPFGGQCVLVNSDVLSFKEDKGHLYATASEPLIIENQALGYRILYDLQHFDASGSGQVYSAGTARFEELKPENEKQANRFQRNRLVAYKGSVRHLMASLVDKSFEQSGFLVYEEDASVPLPKDFRSFTLAAAIGDYKRLVPIDVNKLVKPGRLPNERRLTSARKLIVFYTNATSTFSPYPDARYAYTEMVLPSGQMQMTVDGLITMAEGMVAKGSMGDDRLSTMLPANWKPGENDMDSPDVAPKAIVQGRLAAPDALVGRIAGSFDDKFKVLSPTVYVHIDKPVYVTGDRIWMSAYLLDAANHQRAKGEGAMHVELLTSAGKIVDQQWMRIVDGRGQGNFHLSDTLATGRYRLRAYTDEDDMQRSPAFERTVALYNLVRNMPSPARYSAAKLLDVQILPEGGSWINGLPARLGLKIVQPNGLGLAIDGRIVDDLGAEVVRFKTNPHGMTSVALEPKSTRNYHTELTYNNQRQQVPLPMPEKEGLLLSVDAISDTTQLALSIMGTDRPATDSAYVLIQQRGRVVDQRKVFLQNGVAKVSLPMLSWLPGLAQVTLYDAGMKPHAERLFFVPEFVAPVRVALATHKSQYKPREEVLLTVNLSDNGTPVGATLSTSITDMSKVPDDVAEANFQTHLLLTGELKGRVENPNQYVSDRSAVSRRALDDLLLTQGWRRLSGTPDTELLDGLSIRGRVLNAKNQPISGAQVTFAYTGQGKSFVKTASTDELGRFRLSGLAISDTLQLMAQIADRQSKRLSTKDASLIIEQSGRHWTWNKTSDASDWSALRAQLDAARVRQEANAELYRDKTAGQLEEVTVRGRKTEERPEDIQMRSLHGTADAVVTFNEKSPQYGNVYELIQGRFAGVTVTRTATPPGGPPKPPGYKVTVRGLNSINSGTQPLFLMDGVPIEDPDGTGLMSFNPRDIERVEVLKSAGTTGIYGIRGGNGVIAFYTKRARSMQGGTVQQEGMIPVQFIGYPSVHREFYVPRYDADITSSAVDQRDVLYWKPIIQTDSKGYSQLRFPLSDIARTLRVVVQGVTTDGRPVLGVQVIKVQ